jgi:hypothetical protein
MGDRNHTRFLRLQAMHSTSQSSTWGDVLISGHEKRHAEPLDRLYTMMGMVKESVRLAPDYTLSRNHLLKVLFEGEIKHIPQSRMLEGLIIMIRSLGPNYLFFEPDFNPLQQSLLERCGTTQSSIHIVQSVLDRLGIAMPSVGEIIAGSDVERLKDLVNLVRNRATGMELFYERTTLVRGRN